MNVRVRPGANARRRLAEDVVALLKAELVELAAEGADFVQFDEPLAARRDPAEELEFAVSLINRVVEGVRDVRIGVHVCRGHWSRDETTLLSGSYQPLAPYLERLDVAQLVLEYATDRAGDLMPFGGKELGGLGVVNPRTDVVESSATIRAAVEDALRFYAPAQIFLNPDCGFITFSSRPMNTGETAAAKVAAIVAAARALRG